MKRTDMIKKKNAKRAFTLVELVIVIALLSILAAIAIPVITTTINSSRLATLESNSATVNMLVKEAVNTSKAEIQTVTYNGQLATTATVEDVLIENNIELSVFDVKTIGGVEYAISWDNMVQGTVIISGTGLTPYDITNPINSLE